MNQLITGKEGRQKITDGVDLVANAVKVTLGAKGRNVIINMGGGQYLPHVTKDGVTVARYIKSDDPIEQMGCALIKKVANEVVEETGDSTTTSVILTQDLIHGGNEALDAGFNPIDIKKGIEIAFQETIAKVKSTSKPIESNEELKNIASISANNDYEIGGKIAEAYEKIGHDGVILLEEALGSDTEVKIVDGMKLSRGWISPYFINSKNNECILNNPYILICDMRIAYMKEILPILEQVHNHNVNFKENRDLLLITEDVEGEALAALLMNIENKRLTFNVCAIRTPEVGVLRDLVLKDIAAITNGKVVSKDLGRDIVKQAQLETLGQAGKVKITKNSCTISQGAADPIELEKYVQTLKTQIEETESPTEKEIIKKRIQSIQNIIAVIKVGGTGEVEMKEKMDRLDDAVRATKASIEEGIVAGGGSIFLNISEEIDTHNGANEGINRGKEILKHAIAQPFLQILINAGIEDLDKQAEIKEQIIEKGYGYGYNVISEKVENMLETGIIDPTKVLRVALSQAVSMASVFLTTEAVVSETYKQGEAI